MTVPTLIVILIGADDDWTPADACLRLANAEDDFGMSRSKGEGAPIELKVFPGAYHGLDIPRDKPVSYFGHHMAFDQAATDQASDMLRAFLAAHVGERR